MFILSDEPFDFYLFRGFIETSFISLRLFDRLHIHRHVLYALYVHMQADTDNE